MNVYKVDFTEKRKIPVKDDHQKNEFWRMFTENGSVVEFGKVNRSKLLTEYFKQRQRKRKNIKAMCAELD